MRRAARRVRSRTPVTLLVTLLAAVTLSGCAGASDSGAEQSPWAGPSSSAPSSARSSTAPSTPAPPPSSSAPATPAPVVVLDPGHNGGNADVLAPSEAAAAALVDAFATATGSAPATYPGALVAPGLTRRDDLAGLNLARVPAVFIECANMRNAEDAAAVTDEAWRQRAAQGIADGVLAFLAGR